MFSGFSFSIALVTNSSIPELLVGFGSWSVRFIVVVKFNIFATNLLKIVLVDFQAVLATSSIKYI